MSALRYLNEADVGRLVEALTRDLFRDAPAFQIAGREGRARLLSALDQPRWPHYGTAQVKAAVLHYGLNKNHPYVDGNKRLAVTAMEAFLWMNRVHLLATDDELEQFALDVAADRLSRDRSVDFVVRRAFRWEWSDAQVERRLRAFDRAELGSVLGSGRRVARFDEAIRARVRSLREQVAPYLAS